MIFATTIVRIISGTSHRTLWSIEFLLWLCRTTKTGSTWFKSGIMIIHEFFVGAPFGAFCVCLSSFASIDTVLRWIFGSTARSMIELIQSIVSSLLKIVNCIIVTASFNFLKVKVGFFDNTRRAIIRITFEFDLMTSVSDSDPDDWYPDYFSRLI